jgi:hypothetical protein
MGRLRGCSPALFVPRAAYRGGVEDSDRDQPETAGDEAEQAEHEVAGTDAVDRPVDRFRRSATGAVVAAGLFGLRDALEGRPEKEEVTIVNEAPDARPPDLEIVIDFDHPERSVAVVHRPEDDDGASES